MSGGTVAGREGELQRGSARFSEWRWTRRRGTPIPVDLWERAGGGARSEARGKPYVAGIANRLHRGHRESTFGFSLSG
jgi:hypothetical protein